MTREEAITVLKAFSENPFCSDKHIQAFNVAIRDINSCHKWSKNNLMLVNKEEFVNLFESFTSLIDLSDLNYIDKTHLNSIYGTMVTDNIYSDTDSIKTMEKTND